MLFWVLWVGFLGNLSEGAEVTGVLLERGTRRPLQEVAVYLLPHKLKARTDSAGKFRFEEVPEGEFQWVINLTGYIRYEGTDRVGAQQSSISRRIYLEKVRYSPFETTVIGVQEKRDDTTRSLKQQQFATLPGSGGDPVKAVQTLPGVARVAAFQSQIIIQGSSPKDTKYLVEGHEVPLVFHFGGLTSVTMPEALDRVDYLSAGYGAEYGRAMGGLVALWTRTPRTDRLHGMAYADFLSLGGMLEGPVSDKGSFLIGARQSHIGFLLGQIAKDNEDFDLTLAPSFRDAVAIYEREISPIDRFRLTAIGSNDRLEFLLKEPVRSEPSLRGRFFQETQFVRFIPQLTHYHSDKTISRWSLGAGGDWIRFDLSDYYFSLRSTSLSARAEVEREWTPEWRSFFGLDHQSYRTFVDLYIPTAYEAGGVGNPFSSGDLRKASILETNHESGVYARGEWKPRDTRWTINPQSRVDYFSATGETRVSPRASLKYALSPTLSLRSSGGLYVQPPQPEEVDSTFGNPDLHSPSAWHATLGAEKDFRGGTSRGWILSSGLFFKKFNDLVVPSSRYRSRGGTSIPENYNNDGEGRALGWENMLRAELSPWSGWASYTLSRSTRWEPGRAEYVFPYDQTHNLTVVGALELPKNWKVSSKFRYATGNPYTPITGGIYDADGDVYIPVRGRFYSERLEPFYQLDLRIDKSWIHSTWIFTAYFDIQNVTNRRSVEAVRYSYDYAKTTEVQGLPIIPSLGIKGEF